MTSLLRRREKQKAESEREAARLEQRIKCRLGETASSPFPTNTPAKKQQRSLALVS